MYYKLDQNRDVLVKNILTRGKIYDFLRDSASSALEYTISDEEKPETLAARVYGRSDYHWIILLFNEIHDPYFEWPMSINEMENQLAKTYTGQVVYVDANTIFDVDRKELFDKKNPHFAEGDMVERRNREGNVVSTAQIVSWDPNLYKLVIDSVQGSFVPGESGMDILYSTNSKGKRISAEIKRTTTENRYALHHFESASTGEVISPLYRPRKKRSDGTMYIDRDRLIDRFVFGNVEAPDLGVDDEGNPLGVSRSVTNIEYEEKKNDAKRTIRVMRPEFIDPLLSDFRKLFLVNRR